MKKSTRIHECLINKHYLGEKLWLFVLCVPLFTFGQWNIIGTPINGESVQDWSGSSVSLSGDGNVLAVGALNSDGNGFNSGHVRVYQNLSGTWSQIGNDIDGEAVNDYSSGIGYSGLDTSAISLNSDGSILAIGAPQNDGNGSNSGHVRVFQNVSGTWVQLGQDIDGAAVNDFFGFSVDLNSNGTILAIGANQTLNTAVGGYVKVYEYISGSWTQKGGIINAEGLRDSFGSCVNINDNGNIVAIGAPYNDGSATDSGHVRVYSYAVGQNKNSIKNSKISGVQGTWTQLGIDIDGEATSDRFGSTVSLNATGNIVAVGAKFNTNNGAGSFSGHARVYERISGVWTQVGSDIDSVAQGDEFGYSVSISSDGTRLAAGTRLRDGGSFLNAIGSVRVFDNISGVWTQVHNEILGLNAGEELGSAVSLSGDGYTLVAGAPFNSVNGLKAGQTRVYVDSAVLSVDPTEFQNIVSIYPNPTQNYFEIESNATLSKVVIYSLQGQHIKSFTVQNQYDISSLSSGVYFVKIQANNNEMTKRIIKE